MYRTLSTNYLICSLKNPTFVDIGVLDLLMGIERGNELFGGPRVQTGNAGANPVLLMHMSRIISHKLSTLPRSLFLSYALIASYPKVYSEVSLRDLEEEDSQLLGES